MVFECFIKNPNTIASSDAVAIANTYIIFTTFIFIGVTVVLAVAGYVFTQQFSETKESQLRQLADELTKTSKVDEKLGVALINAILENSDVKRHIDNKLQEKLKELIQENMTQSKQVASQAKEEADTIASLASRMKGNGE